MKFKKFIPLALLSLLVLPSCGSEDVDPNQVEFWHTFGAKTEEAIKKVAADFQEIMKAQGVEVTIKPSYQGGYSDINRKIKDGLAAGNTPTMAIAYPDHVADYLYENNGSYVYNLEPYMESATIGLGKQQYLNDLSSKDDFVEAFIDEGTHFTKQGTYTLPFMKSSEALFYNKSLLVNAYRTVYENPDIAESTIENWIRNVSWEDFIDFCEDAAEKMSTISTKLKYILAYDSDANLAISKMYQNGIAYSSIENGKGKIDFADTTEKSKLAALIDDFKDLHTKKVLTTKGCENKYGSTMFTEYECIFTVGSTGGAGYNDPGTQFVPGVCKVPASNNNPLYVTQGPTLTFLKNSKYASDVNAHKMDLAWQFAKYLTSPEVNTYMCIYGSEGYLPVSYSAYETDAFSEYVQDTTLSSQVNKVLVDDIVDKYLTTPVFPGSATLRTEIEGVVKEVLTGHKTTLNAINDAIANTTFAIK